MKIFISYKRRDEEFAKRLHDNITQWGFNAWLDIIDINPGEEWDTAIHKGLRDSNIVIGLLTPESLASDNVLDEWAYALSNEKRLFLLWMREINEANVPPRYIRLQRIDMRADEKWGLSQLRQALESDAKIIPPNQALPPAALGQGGALPVIAPTQSSTMRHHDERSDTSIRRRNTNRDNMLHKVKNFWVDGVLEQSIHGVALIELGVEAENENVENPWETVLKHQSYGDYQLPSSANIIDIFNELGKEVLILGDPGSGKTTTLLTLARDLIEQAAVDDRVPIPVVFNLSSWADERKPLSEWLVDELNTKYQVPRPTAKDWVEHDDLLLLLDGLDEVDGRYRDLCVVVINDFRSQHGFTSMAVCSRILDYEALSNRLRLNGAIALQPLDDRQIDTYLDSLGDKMSGVREAMRNDKSLRSLAESPLMLSIMTLAFYGLDSADLPALETVEAQRERLFETYTRRMFERRPLKKEAKSRSKNFMERFFKIGQYTQADMLHYLRWLGARMVERKQSVFYIENLQPDWIATERSRTFFRFFGRISYGMFSAVLITVIVIAAFITFLMYEGEDLSGLLGDGNPMGVFGMYASATLIIISIGAALLSVNGMLDHALAKAPPTMLRWRSLLWYFVKMILIASSIALIFSVIIGGLSALLLLSADVRIHGYHWDGIFAVSSIGIGGAALGGAVAALIGVIMQPYRRDDLTTLSEDASLQMAVENQSQARKRGEKLITRGYLATVLTIAGIINLISMAIFLFTAPIAFGYTSSFARYMDEVWYIWNNGLGFFALPFLPTAIVAIIIAYFGRRFPKVTPYVLLTTSISTYISFVFVFAYTWQILVGDSWVEWWYPLTALVGFVVSGLCAGAIGVLFSLIRENIDVSEALRWQWNWRVALVTLVVSVIFSGIVIFQPFANLWSYNQSSGMTPSQEQERLNDYQARFDYMQDNVTARETLYEELDNLLETNEDIVDYSNQSTTYVYLIFSEAVNAVDADLLSTSCKVDDDTVSYYATQSIYLNPTYTNPETFVMLGDSSSQLNPDRFLEMLEGANTAQYLQFAAKLCDDMNYYLRRMNQSEAKYLGDIIIQDIFLSVVFVMTIAVSCIIAAGVVGGIRRTEVVDVRTEPNSGIRQSRKTATRVVLLLALVGFVIGIICGLVLQYISGWDSIAYSTISYLEDWNDWIFAFTVAVGTVLGAIIGLFLGGGDAVIKHVVLRALLQRSDSIPFNYANMLDAAAERILLRKVGGGYIFIHRYLLEYFASREHLNRKKTIDD